MNGMNKLTSEELFQLYLEKKKQENSKKGDQYITCGSCHKKSRIKNFSRVLVYGYEDCPYNPSYYVTKEKALICPKCNILNRFLNQQSQSFLKIYNFNGSYKEEYKHYDREYFTKDGIRCLQPYKEFVNV